MLISCPNCNSVYNISDTRVPSAGKKFKCAECGKVWKVYPQDIQTIEPENKITVPNEPRNTTDDINAMFSRLSHDTKNLFASDSAVDNMDVAQKIHHYWRYFISSYVIIAFLLTVAIILATCLFYSGRYEIVAQVPALEKVYGRFNVESIYNGRDVIFRDVVVRPQRRGNKYSVEISGRLYNKGTQTVRILPVKASFINDKGEVESEIIELLPMQRVKPGLSTLFSIVADNPAANIRKVRLSMEDINQN